jgi:hypothetical protein
MPGLFGGRRRRLRRDRAGAGLLLASGENTEDGGEDTNGERCIRILHEIFLYWRSWRCLIDTPEFIVRGGEPTRTDSSSEFACAATAA